MSMEKTGKQNFSWNQRLGLPKIMGLSQKELSDGLHLIKEHEYDIRTAWCKHFHR